MPVSEHDCTLSLQQLQVQEWSSPSRRGMIVSHPRTLPITNRATRRQQQLMFQDLAADRRVDVQAHC